jgi:CheY-like chemotaxis protein
MATPLKVLILEDCQLDAELMLDHLREAGFDPQSRIVDTELAYLAQLDPTLDLVLSDFSMPQFDARRALQLLKARGLEVPFHHCLGPHWGGCGGAMHEGRCVGLPP